MTNNLIQSPHLTDEQVAQFHSEGFIALQPITTAEDIAYIGELLDGLFARFDELPPDMALDLGDVKNHKGVQRTPQINDAVRFEPRLKDTLYYKNAFAIARQLLGPNCGMRWDHTILKPPQNGKETPWHQDMAYPMRNGGNPNNAHPGCNFWMPLQDATVESGCMQFIPRSHLGNFREHYPVGHDEKVHTLMTDDVDPSKAIACPLPAGGVTIHTPKTLHYTGPNSLNKPRRTWILFFG
jgi:ectoine hydroxylase-related dioxygenase (phytanoyl-CoA dioxygenase family)